MERSESLAAGEVTGPALSGARGVSKQFSRSGEEKDCTVRGPSGRVPPGPSASLQNIPQNTTWTARAFVLFS